MVIIFSKRFSSVPHPDHWRLRVLHGPYQIRVQFVVDLVHELGFEVLFLTFLHLLHLLGLNLFLLAVQHLLGPPCLFIEFLPLLHIFVELSRLVFLV